MRLYRIPLLYERKMSESVYKKIRMYVNVKLRSNGKMNLHVYFLCLSDTETSPQQTKKFITKSSI